MLKIGVFDPGFFDPADSPARANAVLNQLLDVVPQVESLGFSRYWLGEHHDYGTAWRNTEILLSTLAGITENIRIGSAGVLLSLYPPLLIAQNFKLLDYLFSDRIDLGIAKGTAPERIVKAYNTDVSGSIESFDDKVAKLISLLSLHQEDGISFPPYYHGFPPVWILGTGGSSSALVLRHRTSYCLSLFHKFSDIKNGQNNLNSLRSAFEETWETKLSCCIAVAGICSSSNEKAIQEKNKWRNEFIVPTIVGGPNDCFEQLSALQLKYNVEEIIFMDLCTDYKDKIESYSHLSQVFALNK